MMFRDAREQQLLDTLFPPNATRIPLEPPWPRMDTKPESWYRSGREGPAPFFLHNTYTL
jgi:hypothetical protein